MPICIAGPDSGSFEKKKALAMGWGSTSRSRDRQKLPDILQYASQKVVPNSLCSLTYRMQIPDTGLCATGLLKGICGGDSGGPLVFFPKDQPPVEIGVASYINSLKGCGRLLGPAVFSRVSAYYDFIMQT
ncbi:Chymotrypsin-like elastase family member 3B, partial [Stegodyphus mimosarum]